MLTSMNEGLGSGSLYKRQLEDDFHFSWSMPKYKLRKVSAIRDYPPGCGLNLQVVNLRPEEMKTDVGLLGVALHNGLKTNIEDIRKETNEAEACWRRFSAIRDFPPLCGTNVPQEFKDEDQRVIFGNTSLVEVGNVKANHEVIETLKHGRGTRLLGQPSLCNVENDTIREALIASVESMETVIAGAEELGGLPGGEFEKGEFKELGPEQMQESDTKIIKSNENTREIARKEIALYPRDENSKCRSAENVLDIVGPVIEEIVQGLMAAPYCPWRHGKSTLTSSMSRTRKLRRIRT